MTKPPKANIFNHVFKIVELYTEQMNVYGDTGNSLVLQKRLKMYGLKSKIIRHDIGDDFQNDADILVAGGGQDSSQLKIIDDLHKNADKIIQMSQNGVPMLVICGMYQLFGKYFETHTGDKLEGLSIFDAYTIGKDQRIIGNTITQSSRFGTLVGYENHSGQTYIEESSQVSPLAISYSDDGNLTHDGSDELTLPLAESIELGVGNHVGGTTEGCIIRNTIGTYLHGPLLPKNPTISDFLIKQAVENFTGRPMQLTSEKVLRVDQIAELAKKQVTSR